MIERSAVENQDHVLGVGVVGAGWLGDVHARAWGRLRHHYPELSVSPQFVAVADIVPRAQVAARRKHGFQNTYSDWRDLVADPAVDVVSVTAPNALHREIGVAVAEAGKHLWIEKPVGLSAQDARDVASAVAAAGVRATVGFNYREVPAVARLADLVATGAIGAPTHARVHLLTDYAANPLGLLTWRYIVDSGGRGVLGDLASHAVDLVRFTLGDLSRLVAETAIFLTERPLPVEGAVSYGHVLGDPNATTGPVENEDYVVALARTASDVLVTIECSRVATGEQNNYGIEVHGTQGLVAWNLRCPGELQLSAGTQYTGQSTQRLLVGPGAGQHRRFQPEAGTSLSYDDTKVIELANLVRSITNGDAAGPSLADAVAAAEALEAMAQSAAGAGWVEVGQPA